MNSHPSVDQVKTFSDPFAQVVPVFPDSHEIIARIERACANRPVSNAAVAICFPGGSKSFSIDSERKVREVGNQDPLRMPAACMTKLHTATIAIQKCAELGISIDANAQDVLQDLFGLKTLSSLSGITIRHLLNSSHGLDDPRFEPYETKDGLIDFPKQYERFTSVPALSDAGTFFSFSDVGMLFVGAILERATGKSFGNLLKSELLPQMSEQASARNRSGDYRAAREGAFICATAGADFSTSASELLDLAALYFVDKKNSRSLQLLNTMRDKPVQFPGWTGMGLSVGLGWHLYAGGWWGYNGAAAKGESLMLRMQPETGHAMAIISQQLPAHYLATSVFAELLPEAKFVRPPRVIVGPDLVSTDLSTWQGRYEIGSLAADIRLTGKHELGIVIKHRFEDYGPLEAPISRGMRIAQNRVFYTVPAELNFISVGQIVDLPYQGKPQRYLWNSRRLWKRSQP